MKNLLMASGDPTFLVTGIVSSIAIIIGIIPSSGVVRRGLAGR